MLGDVFKWWTRVTGKKPIPPDGDYLAAILGRGIHEEMWEKSGYGRLPVVVVCGLGRRPVYACINSSQSHFDVDDKTYTCPPGDAWRRAIWPGGGELSMAFCDVSSGRAVWDVVNLSKNL